MKKATVWLVLFLLSSLVPWATAATFTVEPVEDAGATYCNLGTGSMWFGAYGESDVKNFIKFTVPPEYPIQAGTVIHSAKLILWGDYDYNHTYTGGPATVYQVADNTWTEFGVTFANAPAFGSVIDTFTYPGDNQSVTLDVTAYVQGEVDAGRTTVSFGADAPHPADNSKFLIWSREAAGANAQYRPTLTIDCDLPYVAAPVISPNGGNFNEPQTVTITCDTPDATIRYTLDGSEPTESSEVYRGSFTVDRITPVKAKAWYSDWIPNATAVTFNYPVQPATPHAALTIDGNLSDWPAASAWSAPFTFWNGAYLTSTTKARFAWNDAQDVLYVAVTTDECSQQAGGHLAIGVSKNIASRPWTDADSTQLCFDFNGGAVQIRNEIALYGGPAGGVVTGVEAACSQDGSTYTYEIAIPLWSNWTAGTGLQNLAAGNTVYTYVIMEDKFCAGNGTNLSYYGNAGFAGSGFANAAALTLMPSQVKPAGSSPMVADPVVYYSFNNPTNLGQDGSGHGYDATVIQHVMDGRTGDPTNGIICGPWGRMGNGVYFPEPRIEEGAHAYYNVLMLPAEAMKTAGDIPTDGFTVAAWTNLKETVFSHQEIASAKAADGTIVFHAELRVAAEDQYRLVIRSNGSTTIRDIRTATGTAIYNDWVHFAGTYDRASRKIAIYINGQELYSEVLDASVALAMAGDWDGGATIGATPDWARPLVGVLDEFYLYKRALSANDIGVLAGTVTTIPGDANSDGKVDVGDLGILAGNYGRDLQTEGVPAEQWWGLGDFNGDGVVDVGDLGILAGNYGTGASGANWDADYAKTFGSTMKDDAETDSPICGALGLPLIAGLMLAGLMLLGSSKLED